MLDMRAMSFITKIFADARTDDAPSDVHIHYAYGVAMEARRCALPRWQKGARFSSSSDHMRPLLCAFRVDITIVTPSIFFADTAIR